jgi:hypothetical protein
MTRSSAEPSAARVNSTSGVVDAFVFSDDGILLLYVVVVWCALCVVSCEL